MDMIFFSTKKNLPHPFSEVEGSRRHKQVNLIPGKAFKKVPF